jgi:hypothetical protein
MAVDYSTDMAAWQAAIPLPIKTVTLEAVVAKIRTLNFRRFAAIVKWIETLNWRPGN